MQLQGFCFANQTYFFFWRSRCRLRRRYTFPISSRVRESGLYPSHNKMNKMAGNRAYASRLES